MGFGGAATAGAATAATGALGGGAGIAGLLGKALSSPIVGNIVSGIGQGMAEKSKLKDQERAMIRADDRDAAQYKGLGDALTWNTNPGEEMVARREQPQTMQTADLSPAAAWTGQRRQGLDVAAAPTPRVQYDRESGRIVRV